MRHSTLPASFSRARLCLLLTSSFLLVAAGSWLVAQDAPKKDPPKKEMKEEVEDTVKPTRKVTVPVDDGDTPPTPATAPASQAVDLFAASQEAKHPVVKELYFNLARPHDIITFRAGRMEYVKPLPYLYGGRADYKGPVETYDKRSWKEARKYDVTLGEETGIEAYENIALAQVQEFLRSGLDLRPKSSDKYLSHEDMLQTAETVLAFVVRFHESARQLRQRVGDGWNKVQEELQKKLLDVQLQQLDAVVIANDWDSAYRMARRFKEAYSSPEVQDRIAEPLRKLIENSIKAQDYAQAQLRTALLGDLFPASKATGSVTDRLRREALANLEEAKGLGDPRTLADNDRKRAVSLVSLAQRKWPQLPGLQDYELQLANAYPILHVGVRQLPGEKNLSPATATTDAERWAVELMFESLLKPGFSGSGGQRYEPALASGAPRLIPQGRQFQLYRNAYWSNGQQVTAVDVSNTVRLLKGGWSGRRPAWADDLVGDVLIGADPFRVNLTFRQGFLDPLSLATFKILPRQQAAGAALNNPDDDGFAASPMGSGPFVYAGRKTYSSKAQKEPRAMAVFTANPYYGSRSGKLALPRVREIHFIASTNPGADFANGEIELFLDLPAKGIKAIESGTPKIRISRPLPNRRVYFLAVNHEKPSLQNQNLRRTLAHAINREAILEECFRRAPGDKAHSALNGLFPAGSWACSPPKVVPADPYVPALAKSLMKAVEDAQARPEKLTLKYPDGDPQLDTAVSQLCLQVRTEIGLELEPQKVEPHALRRDVEKTRDYELAYFHYDYPSEAYWLWPLFDPRASARGNYFSYLPPPDLQTLFHEAMNHRDFADVQKVTQLIHKFLYNDMPLIPLWQLDTYVAYHPDLKFDPDRRHDVEVLPLDPLLMFTEVELWKLEKQSALSSNR